ncbi:MAG: ComEC/Rec2 family competence protein [Gemmatimonadota bacterium]
MLGAAAGRRWCEGRELGRRARGLLLTAAAGAGACALTAPLTALHFQRAAPVAAVSGLVGTPLVGLALLASLAVLLLPGAPLLGPLADVAAGAATGLLRGLTVAVDAFASLPGGYAAAAPPGPVFWAVGALLLWAWVRYVRSGVGARSWTPAAAAAMIALAGPAAGHTWAGLRSGGGTLLCTLDVGQGDAAAIRTRRGHWLLVDAGPGPVPGRGGPDEGLSTVVPFLRDRGARSVELLVLTHPHLDHVGGAPAVLERIPVRRVAGSGSADPGEPHLRFLRSVRAAGSRWLTLRPGDRLRVDEVALLVLDAAGAGSGPGGRPDRNDTGVSLRIDVPDAGFTWVTTGDASVARETAMLGRWPADSLRADLLSVGHHGSRTSTAPAWVAAVAPELAVVSAGAGNRFGHPHPLTLLTLAEAGVPVRRTDRDGTVCVTASPDGSWRPER